MMSCGGKISLIFLKEDWAQICREIRVSFTGYRQKMVSVLGEGLNSGVPQSRSGLTPPFLSTRPQANSAAALCSCPPL